MAGTTFTWTATASSTWSVGSNWSPFGPPTAADTAIVPSGSIQINTGTVGITDLSLGGSLSGPTSGEAAISVQTGGELLVSDAMAVWSGSTLSVDAASFVDIGTSGSAPAGSILVENGNSLLGDGVIVGSVVNNGTIDATNNGILGSSAGGELTIQGTVSGDGTMNIEPGATLQLEGPIGAGETINFIGGGAPETLILDQPSGTISTAINGFADGDRVEFSNVDEINSDPFVTNGNTFTVSVENSSGVDTSYVFTDLNLAPDTPAAIWYGRDSETDYELFSSARFFAWTGDTSTDLGLASNWNDLTDNQDPSLVVPGPTDWEDFNNSVGGTLSGSSSAELANFYNGGSWTLASGADLIANEILIGRAGPTVTLTVGAGATASSGGYIDVGEFSGSNGALTVSGGGVLQDTGPPTTAQFLMGIGTAGASGGLAAATGTVVVTGAGSVVDLGLNGVEIGNNGGSGSVIVSQGGTFIAGTANSNDNISMVIGRTGDGTVIVTGAGSEVEAIGEANIARSGTGDLIVENSGTFLAAVDPVGLAGLEIGGGNTVGVGGLATATVTTDGILVSQGYVIVGAHGTQGELTVSDAGTVQVGTSLVVGSTGVLNGTTYAGTGSVSIDAGSTVELTGAPSTASYGVSIGVVNSTVGGPTDLGSGDVTLSGAGALLNTNGNGITVGEYTNGVLNIGQGTTVESGTPNSADISALAIGRQGDGNVIIDGGSLLANGEIYVGRAGTGDLLVENNGSVNVGLDGTGSTSDAVLQIGGAGASSGSIYYVGGAGSMEVNTGGTVTSQLGIKVGGDGTSGAVSINSGGVVETTQQVLIGTSATVAPGQTIITASGTTVVVAATTEAGDGSVDIGPGGTLAAGYDGTVISAGVTTVTGNALTLGANAESVGTVMVTGAGALLTAASAVHIGQSGQGVLDVLNGGNLQITNTSIGNLDLGGSGNGPAGGTGTVAVASGGSIEADAGLYIWAGSTLSVDASSGVDVGTSGAYVAGAVNIESGHNLFGDGLIDAAVADGGGITASNDGTVGTGTTLEITGAVSGAGTLAVASSSVVLQLDAAPGIEQTVVFDQHLSGDTLVLNSPIITGGGGPSTFVAMESVAVGDRIDFGGGILINGVTQTATGGGAYDVTVSVTKGGTAGVITFDNVTFGAGATSFLPGTDTNGDASIQAALCFAAGTRIATERGEIAVEDLHVGDTVHAVLVDCARPIIWIGTGRVLATRGRRNAATPVIVRKGALADDVPHRDLHVTKGHSLYIDGVLIPVEFLVNHRSILWDDRAQEVEVYHIELETHDVLLANGAAAEGYRDDGNRWLFQNANSGWGMAPKEPCAPVLTGGPVVDRVWRRLLDRAGPRPGLPLTGDPDLHLLVGGDRLGATSRHGAAYLFRLPARPAAVRIVSRAGAPAELGLARDPRVLGVAVRRIAVRQGTRFHVLEAADASLAEGFREFELDNGLRWTDGDAALPEALFEGFDGPMELVLHVGGTTSYLADYPIQRVA